MKLECGCDDKCLCPIATDDDTPYVAYRSNGRTCLIGSTTLDDLKKELELTGCVICNRAPIHLICPECRSGPCLNCLDNDFEYQCAREEAGEDPEDYLLCKCYDLIKENFVS